jgi:8-oxo-dGTP diphosphatase
MERLSRPAARIVCLDAEDRVLLLRWQDPFDGTMQWAPPGGGIDPGETPIEAARRELVEETRLDPTAIIDRPVLHLYEWTWKNTLRIGPETFFLARYATDRPEPDFSGLEPAELDELRGFAWRTLDEIAAMTERLDPPALLQIIAELRS